MMSESYNSFIVDLNKALDIPLPGTNAHDMLAPANRKQLLLQNPDISNAQQSSVLILFFPDKDNNPSIVFTKRVEYKGVHSGQVSFPGGKAEKDDKDFVETAYRETEEEIGIKRNNIQTLGVLTQLYVPPSNFIIFPVVSYMQEQPVFIPDNKEVAEIIVVPFNYFLNNGVVKQYPIKTHDSQLMHVPGYMIGNHLIWGATAMILNELITIVRRNPDQNFN